jgi:hypothetical protein
MSEAETRTSTATAESVREHIRRMLRLIPRPTAR